MVQGRIVESKLEGKQTALVLAELEHQRRYRVEPEAEAGQRKPGLAEVVPRLQIQSQEL